MGAMHTLRSRSFVKVSVPQGAAPLSAPLFRLEPLASTSATVRVGRPPTGGMAYNFEVDGEGQPILRIKSEGSDEAELLRMTPGAGVGGYPFPP